MRNSVVSVIVLSVCAGAASAQLSTSYIPAPAGGYSDRIPSLNEGFETFAPGPISGQNGWTTFAANGAAPVISSANPASGSQHLLLSAGPGSTGSFNGAFSPDFGDFSNDFSSVSVDVLISNTGDQDAAIIGQAPSQALLTWRALLNFQGNILVLDDVGAGLAFVDTGADWTPGQYFNFRVDTNPAADTINYYYNNSLIYSSVSGVFAATAVEQVILFGDNFFSSSSFTAYDNLTIVPAPGAAALLGLGGLLVARRRR
ncbi:MAG: hypothetical protein SFY69_12685 [Planctomycetota bacterium]|nr:hypothetical protein [Planctomycetota bacterium]